MPQSKCDSLYVAQTLHDIYCSADALFEGWSCDDSTECCRFGVTGRSPYVTLPELERVVRAVASRGLRLERLVDPKARRVLPLAGHKPKLDEQVCPLLDASGRCRVYADRPLGCRTFFCSRASRSRPVPKQAVLELVTRLRQLCSEGPPGSDVGRPLVAALSERVRRL